LKLFILGSQVPNMNNTISGYVKPYRIPPTPNTKSLNKSWTQEEIQMALTQIKNKRTPEDIAKKLNRPVSDIRSKLKTIAADMYMKNNIPYDEIHEATGVEKNTLVISPGSVRNNTLDDHSDDDQEDLNISIYDFPEDCDTMIHVDIKDNPEEVIVTVSVESPFSPRSFCEYISTPIFSTCSRFAKIIS